MLPYTESLTSRCSCLSQALIWLSDHASSAYIISLSLSRAIHSSTSNSLHVTSTRPHLTVSPHTNLGVEYFSYQDICLIFIAITPVNLRA